MSCTTPITTKQQSVFWLVSQSRDNVGHLTRQLSVAISCGGDVVDRRDRQTDDITQQRQHYIWQ